MPYQKTILKSILILVLVILAVWSGSGVIGEIQALADANEQLKMLRSGQFSPESLRSEIDSLSSLFHIQSGALVLSENPSQDLLTIDEILEKHRVHSVNSVRPIGESQKQILQKRSYQIDFNAEYHATCRIISDLEQLPNFIVSDVWIRQRQNKPLECSLTVSAYSILDAQL